MQGRNANVWARLAAWFTGVAYLRAPAVRWGAVILLLALWLGAGYIGWSQSGIESRAPISDSIYRTIGAIGYEDSYSEPPNALLRVARFAGLAVPVIGLLFAFSGQIGASLAQACMSAASRHVVIAGTDSGALCLARDCAKSGDAVVVIGDALPRETAWSLRKTGIMFMEGDPTQLDAMRQARAKEADHVIAFEPDDAANLRIEAAARTAAAARHRATPLTIHVAMRSPILLLEAREMRQHLQRAAEARNEKPDDHAESRPFAPAEIAARLFLQAKGPALLSRAESQNQIRPHLVIFGYDEAAEAIAVRALMSLWSARFDAPRITIVVPDPEEASRRFDARYPEARANDLWRADIAFWGFDWTLSSVRETFLGRINDQRGPATAVIVSAGDDASNIALALALLRACHLGPNWPAPIYLHVAQESEFSKRYAAGDPQGTRADAFLEAFGGDESIATRELILDGELDRGAAMAHGFYVAGAAGRGEGERMELDAIRRAWSDVGETYRNANRAVADHALMKLWDVGWEPVVFGGHEPSMNEAEIARLARLEHDRWVAERTMSGWRWAEKRDNALRLHPNLVSWEALSVADQEKDADQVRGALTLARALYPSGFRRRVGADVPLV